MMYSKELIEKAKQAKSAEELIDLALEEGIELSKEKAQVYFDFLNGDTDLSEEELDVVAGGKGEPPIPEPKYRVGQRCLIYWPSTHNFTPGVITVVERGVYDRELGTRYMVLLATQSGHEVELPFYLETMETATVYP